MKCNKGFTLVEIIICVSLVAIIFTTSIIVLNVNKNKVVMKVTQKILKASQVYVSSEKDEKGNSYENGIFLGGTGLVIPLKVLENNGYISSSDLKTLEQNNISKEEYVVVGVFSGSKDKCDSEILEFKASWDFKDEEEVLYLCSGNLSKDKSLKTNFLDKVLDDNYGNLSNENRNVELERDDFDEAFNLVGYTDYDYASNNSGIGSSYPVGYLETNGIHYFIKHDKFGLRLNKNSKINYYYYKGNVTNNFIKLIGNGKEKMGRILEIYYNSSNKLRIDILAYEDFISIEKYQLYGKLYEEFYKDFIDFENSKYDFSLSDLFTDETRYYEYFYGFARTMAVNEYYLINNTIYDNSYYEKYCSGNDSYIDIQSKFNDYTFFNDIWLSSTSTFIGENSYVFTNSEFNRGCIFNLEKIKNEVKSFKYDGKNKSKLLPVKMVISLDGAAFTGNGNGNENNPYIFDFTK